MQVGRYLVSTLGYIWHRNMKSYPFFEIGNLNVR